MADLKYYLVFDHVNIQGANAISSPLTYGFPAITGFLGSIHALNRKIDPETSVYLDGVLIACHDCDVQTYRANSYADYTFKLTRNPLGKDGKARSIIEEGKVHLDVTLVVEVKSDHFSPFSNDEEQKQAFISEMKTKLYQQRIAGGSVMGMGDVQLYSHDEEHAILSSLAPAFVLVEAKDELIQITEELQVNNPDATALDALMETAMLHHQPPTTEDKEWSTVSVKRGRGWLVPIHLGYQGISPLFMPGKVDNARSNEHTTQYVECIYGLGKWVFPFRLTDKIEQAFWRYKPATLQSNDADLYIISQEDND